MRELMAETRTQKLFWDDERNIVWGELKALPQTLDTAIENIDVQERIRDTLRKEMTRVIVDMRVMTSISASARRYYAGERTAKIQRATALLVRSPVSVVMGNFFMGLNKPISPTRMFNDPERAIGWLAGFQDA